jgi:hypothetical protein
MFTRVCGDKYFFRFTMFTDGRTEPPLSRCLFNLLLCLQRHAGKGFQRFSFFYFLFLFLRPVFNLYFFGAVRCGARTCRELIYLHCAVPLLLILLRAGIHSGAKVPTQKRQKIGSARRNCTPPCRKNFRFRRGGRLAKPLYSPDTIII